MYVCVAPILHYGIPPLLVVLIPLLACVIDCGVAVMISPSQTTCLAYTTASDTPSDRQKAPCYGPSGKQFSYHGFNVGAGG